jgi:diguanylate cyclase (GGDEF)-like protein
MIETPVFEPCKFLILAVDDTPANLKVLQGVLIPAGYRVTFATRGKQVLERIRDIKPDLILLDLMMPEMSGLEVCNLLKQIEGTGNIPIIFLTASQEAEHLIQAFESGAVDYITKPFKTNELLVRIRNHLELSQLRQQAQRQAMWEAISRQIVQDIHASIDLQDVLNNTTRVIQQSLKADRVMIYRWCDPRGCGLLAIAGQDDATQREICQHRLGCPFLQQNPYTMSTVEQQTISSTAKTASSLLELGGTDSAQQELRLPIFQNEELWGGLVIQTQQTEYDLNEQTIEVLTHIVRQLEISIQHAALLQQLKEANVELEKVSNTDALTQIANRRCFDTRFAQEWQRLQREQQPLSLILCDVDHFKQFNDTYGHPRGDVCLAAIGRVLQSCLKRPADFVARYGGEEFVILLPNTPTSGAIEVVQQVQDLIATLKITHESADANQYITLSFGIYTEIPMVNSETPEALERADRALYEAKKAGRNQYAIAPSNFAEQSSP